MRNHSPALLRLDGPSSIHGRGRVLSPNDEHWILLRRMIVEGQASGALISDAQLAALTMEYGGVLHTTDRDFARFPDLRWTNPLALSNAGLRKPRLRALAHM